MIENAYLLTVRCNIFDWWRTVLGFNVIAVVSTISIRNCIEFHTILVFWKLFVLYIENEFSKSFSPWVRCSVWIFLELQINQYFDHLKWHRYLCLFVSQVLRTSLLILYRIRLTEEKINKRDMKTKQYLVWKLVIFLTSPPVDKLRIISS